MAKAPQAARRPRIAVASEQTLVAEAVRAALQSRGFDTGTVRWPGSTALRIPSRRLPYDAGVLISELDRPPRVRAASVVTRRVPIRWTVLTSAPRGPLWGAVLDAGAALVLPSETPLNEVVDALSDLMRRRGEMEYPGRDELVADWARLQAQQTALAVRVRSLTPREREVLTLLHAGDTVAGIASLLDIAPATVRSQVKAVLRKLEVNSQLAAVAAYATLLEVQASEQEYDGPVALRRA